MRPAPWLDDSEFLDAAYRMSSGGAEYLSAVEEWKRRHPVVGNDAEMVTKRRAVCDAVHNMHADQALIVDMGLAQELGKAWAEYDALIESRAFAKARAPE